MRHNERGWFTCPCHNAYLANVYALLRQKAKDDLRQDHPWAGACSGRLGGEEHPRRYRLGPSMEDGYEPIPVPPWECLCV